METIKTKQLLEVNIENINKAIENIKLYAHKKDFIIMGNFDINTFKPEFSSLRSEKKFKKSLTAATSHLTMKSANLFLHHLSKYSDSTLKVNYSEKEFQIIEKRNKWKEANKIALQLLAEYKTEKGDYYKVFKQ